MFRLACLALLVGLSAAGSALAQTPADRERARIQNKVGWEYLRAEAWEDAAAAFQRAIDIDRTFEDAYYGLGRAELALKQFVKAIDTFTACRNLYLARAGKQFASQQEAQRYRRDQLLEINERIRLMMSMPQTAQRQDSLRQLNNYQRQLQEAINRGNSFTIDASVPPWVTLSLGSAYFRAGRFEDAEREWRATIEADSKSGETHSNLAVLYMETGRLEEAEASIKAARKAGFRVNPRLEEEIQARKRRP
jgi:tetratricopeptide (TPR) repeat protein